MKNRMFALTLRGCALVLGFQTSLMGQIFFTESFDYADGDLVTVSGGLWATHSGVEGDIQVVAGDAIVTAGNGLFDKDDSRLTGAVMGVNDVWYYAVRFSVELGDEMQIDDDYFIHFKDNKISGYNARLALDNPTDTNKDFSLSIWASSVGDGRADWAGDFDFGEEIIAVVEWNNGTGDASLWVNPVDMSSTSITDNELADAMRLVESLALRQDSSFKSSIITIPVLSVGTGFNAVLAEVTPAGDGVVTPASFEVSEGEFVSGGLPDLEVSDNMDLTLRRRNGDLQSRTEFEVKSTSPTATPTRFEFTLEGSVFARGNVVQTIELFDYVVGAWELVDTTDARRAPAPDSVVTVAATGDLSRFVEAGTTCIEARIRYKSDANRQKFASNTDQAVWTIE